MRLLHPDEPLTGPSIQDNDAFWSLVNFGDDASTKDFWVATDVQVPPSATGSSDCSPTSQTYSDGRYTDALAEKPDAGIDGTAMEDLEVANNKRAKRQAQNRIAQQAFRARKEKLVRSLSVDLATLQSQYATTKAENERLSNDLRLAQTELSAIRSVLHRTAPTSPGGIESVPFTTRMEPKPGDGGYCTLTLHINLDNVMAERSRRQAALASPPASETGEMGIGVDLGALCEPLRLP